MSVAKPSSSGSPIAMKSEEMNDSVQPPVRQDIGQEPVIHESRTEENTVHWIQLLHAFDQPDLHDWPLMSPIKVPLQKCNKCFLEFCSPINYRRHIRVHHQCSTLNKESNRNEELLAAFWDKLALDKADEIASFNEVMLKVMLFRERMTSQLSSAMDAHLYPPHTNTVVAMIMHFPVMASNADAKEFLDQRWKAAVAADHVVLAL